MTDPIADMLTRIRNSAASGKSEITLPLSKIKYQIAKILEKEGWIQKCEEVVDSSEEAKNHFKELKIVLKYKKSGRSAITSIKRISKPSIRVYAKKGEMPTVLSGFGTAIISTSKGLMTAKEARQEKMGGEIICEVF
jgi:small subunit ribosomal protein S8